MKYYFCRDLFDEELCYPLKAILDEMAEHNMDSVMVTEAVRVTGFFYCKKYNEFGITGDSDCGKSCDFYKGVFYCKKYNEFRITGDSNCGKSCDFYKPRNGKNGICQHWGYTYEEGEKKYRLYRNGVKKLINDN